MLECSWHKQPPPPPWGSKEENYLPSPLAKQTRLKNPFNAISLLPKTKRNHHWTVQLPTSATPDPRHLNEGPLKTQQQRTMCYRENGKRSSDVARHTLYITQTALPPEGALQHLLSVQGSQRNQTRGEKKKLVLNLLLINVSVYTIITL